MSKRTQVDAALAELPPVLTPTQLGLLLAKSADALAQDRYLRKGVPFVKYGSRVYYLRSDVIAFFAANRHTGESYHAHPAADRAQLRAGDLRDAGTVSS
jgi:hypothetical protein